MFDFPAWMDEVHIVEMGRNVLSGGSASILMQPDGSIATPFYYLGPVLQELCFRALGPLGPRLSSFLGLVAAALAFRWFLRTTERDAKPTLALAPLLVFSLPLFIQSVRQVRIDCWVFAAAFLVCGLLARHRVRAAAALAAVTPFLWPSAVLLFPLFLAVFLERRNKVRELLPAALVFLSVTLACCLPIRSQLSAAVSAFGNYYAGVGHAAVGTSGFSPLTVIRSTLVLVAKETLRAPPFALLVLLGIVPAFRNRRLCLFALPVIWILAQASGMHTFRFIYLMPVLLVLATEALARGDRLCKCLALIAIATGLIGFWSVLRPHHATPADLTLLLGKEPRTVLVPGYATYYDLRRRGDTPLAIGEQGGYADTNRIVRLLDRCDAVLVESEDRYAAIEESPTLYGLLRDQCLEAARTECGRAAKSIPAQIGEAFAYGAKPDMTDLLQRQGYTRRNRQATFTSWERRE